MRSFIAPPHPSEQKVYDLKEKWDGSNGIGVRRKLNTLIKETPDLIEAYNFRHDILQHEDHLVAMDREADRAFKAVITHYFPDEKFPEILDWGFLENRPILRAIFNYALCCWHPREKDKAIELFEKLLDMNPNDNLGARFCLLGIYEGMSYNSFFKHIEKIDQVEWFEENCQKYPILKYTTGGYSSYVKYTILG